MLDAVLILLALVNCALLVANYKFYDKCKVMLLESRSDMETCGLAVQNMTEFTASVLSTSEELHKQNSEILHVMLIGRSPANMRN